MIDLGRWCLLLMIFLGEAVLADPKIIITAILSQEGEPYRQVIEGVKNELERNNVPFALNVEIYSDSAQRRQEIRDSVSDTKSRILLPLGTKATEFAVAAFKKLPICAGLIVDDKPLNGAANATGSILRFSIATHLEWLRRFSLQEQTVAVLYNPENQQEELNRFKALARKKQISVSPQPVRDLKELPSVLERMPGEVGVLWSFTDAGILNVQTAKQLLLFSFRNRIPLIGLSNQWTKAGALYSLDRDYYDIGMQCGELIRKILQGMSPKTLPVETPRKIVYTINLKTARHMKLDLPESLIQGAHETY
ncbi:MAG: ABC transporter substrate-binding protein [Gammaproteobacteria bacterium]